MRRLLLVLTALLVLPGPAALGLPAPAHASWTWPVRGDVITPYRNGSDPYAAGQHRGIDIRASVGTPVVAAEGGEVRFAGTAGSSGLTVSVRTGDGFDSSYLHLSSLAVRAGEHVSAGERLGAVGITGERSATEPHLHFGVREAGSRHAYRDPLSLLPPPPAPPATPPEAPRPAPEPAPAPAPPAPRPAPAPAPAPAPGRAPRPAPAPGRAPRPAPAPGRAPRLTPAPGRAPRLAERAAAPPPCACSRPRATTGTHAGPRAALRARSRPRAMAGTDGRRRAPLGARPWQRPTTAAYAGPRPPPRARSRPRATSGTGARPRSPPGAHRSALVRRPGHRLGARVRGPPPRRRRPRTHRRRPQGHRPQPLTAGGCAPPAAGQALRNAPPGKLHTLGAPWATNVFSVRVAGPRGRGSLRK